MQYHLASLARHHSHSPALYQTGDYSPQLASPTIYILKNHDRRDRIETVHTHNTERMHLAGLTRGEIRSNHRKLDAVAVIRAKSPHEPQFFDATVVQSGILCPALLAVSLETSDIRYGVVANIIASHAIARGSIPRVGIFFVVVFTLNNQVAASIERTRHERISVLRTFTSEAPASSISQYV